MTSHNKKRLIILPCFNEEDNIYKCLESIKSQTFQDWEVIISDDASTDRTVDIVNEFALQDKRVKLEINAVNSGLAASLNKGISLANCDLNGRVDADDICLSRRFELQVQFMDENPDIDVLGTATLLTNGRDDNYERLSLPVSHDEIVALPFLKTMLINPSVVIRKTFFEKAGYYYEDLLRAQDKELWIRGICSGAIYANLSTPLIIYNTNGYVR